MLTPLNAGKEPTRIESESVTLGAAAKSDEGTYLCRVDNGIGASLEKTVHLAVKCTPMKSTSAISSQCL